MRQVGQLPRIIAWCTVNKTLKVKFLYTYLLTSFPFSIYLNNTHLFPYKISYKTMNFKNSFQRSPQQQVRSNNSFTPNLVFWPQYLTSDLIQHGELIQLEDDRLNEPNTRTTIWQRKGEVLAKTGLNSETITSALRLSYKFWGDHLKKGYSKGPHKARRGFMVVHVENSVWHVLLSHAINRT